MSIPKATRAVPTATPVAMKVISWLFPDPNVFSANLPPRTPPVIIATSRTTASSIVHLFACLVIKGRRERLEELRANRQET